MRRQWATLALWGALATAQAGVLDGARCVAPAKPGGGFDLTCQLLASALEASGQTAHRLPVVYQPGGIGALAFRRSVTQQPADSHTLVAFSSGSLLNLAQGRFGPHTERDVRWLAAIGMDYGVIAVHRDAPYRSLPELLDALRRRPAQVVFGAGGSIGSQDWMKAALLARAAGVSHKTVRFVAFEGGGEALAALAGHHVQVLAGDAAEVARHLEQGAPIRVLAVLAAERLRGTLAGVPTAAEQGFDIRWPILRGVYLGPGVAASEVQEWREVLARASRHPSWVPALWRAGLQPAWISGPELDAQVARQIADYRQLAIGFGLLR